MWDNYKKERQAAFDNYKKEHEVALGNYKKEKDSSLEKYKENIYGKYAEEYKTYKNYYYIHAVLEFFNPFVYLDFFMSKKRPKRWGGPPLDTYISPENVYARNSVIDTETTLSSMRAEAESEFSSQMANDKNSFFPQIKEVVNNAYPVYQKQKETIKKKERACLAKLAQVPRPRGNYITSGTYPSIPILPKKYVEIYVPFRKEKGDYLNKINFLLYDLPTKVNAAGIVTKRSNFNIKLKKVKN